MGFYLCGGGTVNLYDLHFAVQHSKLLQDILGQLFCI